MQGHTSLLQLIHLHRHPQHFLWQEALVLIKEYRAFLDEDICFQKPDDRAEVLKATYSLPQGALIMALLHDEPVGMVALQKIAAPRTAEMKRLYVRPAARAMGLGKKLIVAIEQEAALLGYERICLDTLPKLQAAIHLYTSLGYTQARAYYHNPLGGVMYFEKQLSGASSAADTLYEKPAHGCGACETNR